MTSISVYRATVAGLVIPLATQPRSATGATWPFGALASEAALRFVSGKRSSQIGWKGAGPSIRGRRLKTVRDQNTAFSANCQLRPEGETTPVTVPKAELVGVVLGLLKLTWLKAL